LFHIKISALVSFVFLVHFIFLSISQSFVQSEPLVNGVQTHISAFCDGSTYDFETKSNNILDALEETPCRLDGNDVSDPEKDTILNGGNNKVSVTREIM
jgi:hypothetical protein